ncbi:MAG: MFS transporter [Chloroflexota bacterium]
MPLTIPPSLRHSRFRLLWIGLLISVAGSRMQFWGLLWHIRTLSDQPIALGAIGLARILPVIFFSLIGGALADVVNRRRVLFFTQAVLILVALSLGVLTLGGQITLWHIYTLTIIQAIAISFDLPARQSLVPNLVSVHDLPNAFSMQSIAFTTGSIVGPALSGLVIGYLGQTQVYFINAATYLAIIAALVLMGSVQQQSDPTHPTRVDLPAVREGVHFIWKQPIILSSMLLDFFATFFSSANALLPIFARDILYVGAMEYGWLSAAQSIGAAIAAIVISQLKEIRRQGPVLLGSVVVFGLATVGFGVSNSFLLTMLSLAVMGASDSVSVIIRNTIRQLQTPDYLRGRMVSVNQIFFMGGPQLGEVEAGLVAQFFGAPLAVISGGVACILAVGWVTHRWPQLRHYNGDEPVLAGATTS